MEICLSYFLVNENYTSRQKKRLLEDYGFKCNCESNYSDNDCVEEEEEQCENIHQTLTIPHIYFFLKYMCDRTDCIIAWNVTSVVN
jgi:hypothetical protein